MRSHQVAAAVAAQTSEAPEAVFWIYAGFVAVVLVMLALDLGVFHRHAHEVRMGEALSWTVVWVACALAFNVPV